MWNETNAQRDGIIERFVGFPERPDDLIMAGAQIGVGLPFMKTPRSICKINSDYDVIDLVEMTEDYMPRSIYKKGCDLSEYYSKIPETASGIRYDMLYRIFSRKMIDPEGARTIMSALLPPYVGHTSGISGISIADEKELLLALGCLCSLPVDYMVKATAKANFQASTIRSMPTIESKSHYADEIIVRVLKLNCLTKQYAELWERMVKQIKNRNKLSIQLNQIKDEWDIEAAFRTDLERREALLEIDVLVSMAFGMKLDDLITIYNLQFHILKNQEADTWYDSNGRIVFTNNRALNNVGFSRKEWENIKDAKSGTFTRIIEDDTMPGGPILRTIEYIAPFDRCDRIKDYEEVWHTFEERFAKS
jgi:hypothetical protein